MRKLLTTILMLTFISGYSQDAATIDSTNVALINAAGKNLQRFEAQNVAGYLLCIGGTILTTISLGQKDPNPYTTPANTQTYVARNRGFTIAGVALSLLGGCLVMSSSSQVSSAGRKLRKVKRTK